MAVSSQKNISHKTDAVMKLLTGSNLAVNPMLDNEFKQSVIEMRSSPSAVKETAEEPVRSEKDITMHKNTGEQHTVKPVSEICVSSELITEILPNALKRFHCCTCGKCFAEAMADALDTIPYISVKVREPGDLKKAEELKSGSRREVMKEIIRIAIARRSLPKHDEK